MQKSLMLIMKNIRTFIKDSPALFVIFIVSQFITVLCFMYVHANLSSLGFELDLPDSKISMLELEAGEDFGYEEFESRAAELVNGTSGYEKPSYIALRYVVLNEIPDEENLTVSELMRLYPEELKFISCVYGENDVVDHLRNDSVFRYGSFFTDEQLNGNDNAVLLAAEALPGEDERMKEVTIGGTDFSVAGQISTNNGNKSYIPYASAKAAKLVPEAIEIHYDSESVSDIKVLSAFKKRTASINKYLPDYKMKPVSKTSFFSLIDTIKLKWQQLLVLVLAVVDFCSLNIFIFMRRRNTLHTYNICGASERRCRYILFGELFGVTAAVYLVCFLLMKLLFMPLMFTFSPHEVLIMTGGFFIRDFLFICLILYLVCSPFIERLSKPDSISNDAVLA